MLSTTEKQMYIMNPFTRRSIVVGGRVYKSLVKKGFLDPNTHEFIDNSNKVGVTLQGTPSEEEEYILKRNVGSQEVLLPPPEDEQYTEIKDEQLHQVELARAEVKEEEINRTKFEKILDDLKKQNKNFVSDLIAKASQNVLEKYRDKLSELDDDERLYEEINCLIEAELEELLET